MVPHTVRIPLIDLLLDSPQVYTSVDYICNHSVVPPFVFCLLHYLGSSTTSHHLCSGSHCTISSRADIQNDNKYSVPSVVSTTLQPSSCFFLISVTV